MTKSQKRAVNQKKKELAMILFQQDYSQKEIAAKLEISEQTVSRWAKLGNWDKIKTNLTTSRHNRLSELYEELAEFNQAIKLKKEGERFASSKEADARRKLISDIKDLEGKYSIGEAISIGREFTSFVRDVDFELSTQIIEYYDAYINSLIEKQRWGKTE